MIVILLSSLCRYDLNALATRMEQAQQNLAFKTKEEISKMSTVATLASAMPSLSVPSTSRSSGQDSLFYQTIQIIDASTVHCQKLFAKHQEKSKLFNIIAKNHNPQQPGSIGQYLQQIQECDISCRTLEKEKAQLIMSCNNIIRAFNKSSLAQNQKMNDIIRGKRAVLAQWFNAIEKAKGNKQESQDSQVSSTKKE